MTRTFHFNENKDGNNAVQVSVRYRKAGINYFNAKHEESGFYVGFTTGRAEKDDIFSTFRFMLGDGVKFRVKDGSRDSKKTCQALLSLVTESMAELAFNGDYESLSRLIKA